MLKRILIPLDPSPYTRTALEMGCAIARWHDAEITGLVILDIPGIRKSVGPVPLGGLHFAEELTAHRRQVAEDRIHQLLTDFRSKCQQEGVRHREAEFQGRPSEFIIRESLYFDAVIMGLRTYFRFDVDDHPGDTLADMLDHTVTPVYGVPESFTLPQDPGEKLQVLITFDGSLPAARALQRFTQLVQPEQMAVTLLTAHGDPEVAHFCQDRAADYLQAHGVTDIQRIITEDDILEVLDTGTLEDYHLVVAGAHAKKGLFDFVLGSVVHHLIKVNLRPVLIGQ